MVPVASRAAYLVSYAVSKTPYAQAIREAAHKMQMYVIPPSLEPPFQEAQYRRAFAAMTQERADVLIVSDQPENLANRRLITELAEQARIPAIYPYREFADEGGLIAYGIDLPQVYRHAADQVGDILKGTKPSEIPFYQPTKFDLVINLKAASALGLIIPQTLLARADEVIE
jgi:putative ABC transport system substrate-binding protein